MSTLTRIWIATPLWSLLLISLGLVACHLRYSDCIRQIINNGRSLYLSITPNSTSHARSAADRQKKEAVAFPSSADAYASSTEYFQTLINERWIVGATPQLFADPSRHAQSTRLTSDMNIWAVVLDIDPLSGPPCPYLITSNADIRSLSDLTGTIRMTSLCGEDKAVIIMSDGSASLHDSGNISSALRQPATNGILRP